METVKLDLAENSYTIQIGAGLFQNRQLLTEQVRGRQVFIVSNQTVADLYLDQVRAQLSDFDVGVHLMPDGEQHKNLATLEAIIGDLLAQGHTRATTIFALGGGVVGDTAGFAAATYQRGVPFVQLPTTLLSQVDSSVGGKTAVNHPSGKNMIGAFYQPRSVVIDTESLATLPARELSAGLAEVIKHGVLSDPNYFEQVEADMQKLRDLDQEALTRVIRGSCEIKAGVVAADEKETGRRALLNLGHTFGHAIETGLGYGAWLHGEAVGVGLVMAVDLSMRLGRCTREDAQRVKQLVHAAGLPIVPPQEVPVSAMLALMGKDKKANDAGIRFVLLAGSLGSAELVADVPDATLIETLEAGTSLCE